MRDSGFVTCEMSGINTPKEAKANAMPMIKTIIGKITMGSNNKLIGKLWSLIRMKITKRVRLMPNEKADDITLDMISTGNGKTTFFTKEGLEAI